MKKSNPFSGSEIEKRITDWNLKFPFDYHFRTKYNIPFGSETHRQMDFFDMKFDIFEERYFNYISEKNKNKVKSSKQLLKSKVLKASEKMSEEEFEDFDLSAFDDKK